MAYRFTIAVVGSCKRSKDATPWLNGAFDKIQRIYAGNDFRVMTKCNERLAKQAEEAAARRGWSMEPLDPPALWGAAVSINADSADRKLVEAFTKHYRLVGFTPLWKYPQS